jgi:phospholipid/cholesterol/gamma-HCH transport system substrate-binding protein
MQSLRVLRNPITLGVGGLAIVAVLVLVAALLYISPPGQKTVTFYTDDAASIRLGDDVRIAGIPVGKVDDISLDSDQVQVRAKINEGAFVGDQSQVQVRMLTVVGGYYVSIESMGDTPLGANSIPLERVKMPYSLIRTLTDATNITNNVNAKPIKESLDEMQKGLAGTNVESLSAVINAGNSLMSTIDKQRGQVTSILDMSDEYIQSLSNFREELKQIVLKVSIIEQTLVLYSAGFGSALKGVGDILEALLPIGNFYDNHRDKFLEKVRQWQEKGRFFVERNDVIVRGLHRVQDKLERVLDAQNAAPELLATDLCMPVPGSPC